MISSFSSLRSRIGQERSCLVWGREHPEKLVNMTKGGDRVKQSVWEDGFGSASS